MSILEIIEYPDPRLTQQCAKVTDFDEHLKKLADDMVETMYVAPGVGLAAPQVGITIRLLVSDPSHSDEPSELYIMVNPVILKREGSFIWEEGCLSVPGVFEEVNRANWIQVSYQDLDGNVCLKEFSGFPAVVIQHEMDHLDGIVFVDRLSRLKRKIVVKRFLKDQTKRLEKQRGIAT